MRACFFALKEDIVSTVNDKYVVERENDSPRVLSEESLKGVVTAIAHHEVLKGKK